MPVLPLRIVVRRAFAPEEVATTRELLREYAGYLNESLGEEHICLAEYEKELEALPGVYAEPAGTILLAYAADGEVDEAAGCVALKPLAPSRALRAGERACEMKRLWVRPKFRGHAIGLKLAEALTDAARLRGYTAMYLDTIPGAMQAAHRVYQKLGFAAVERYNINPILGIHPLVAVQFFRLEL